MDTKKTSDPIVSVIMPAYNSELYIEAAIRSVMKQIYSVWELIVVDDASTDSTCSIVEHLSQEDSRIRLVQNPNNIGAARTRNRGLALCNGDFVAFLDSDDTWLPDKLLIQMQKIKDEKADLVYSSYAIVNAEGHPSKMPYIVPDTITFEALLKENVIGCSTVLMSHDIAKQYRFVVDFYHEDYCLWLNILRDGHKAVGCSDILVEWRLISNSRSFNKKNSAKNRWKIYRNYLNFSVLKSIKLFFHYMISGIKKYR